jgi:hypothetical protein
VSTFACSTCFDTLTIDQDGAVVTCPVCEATGIVTVKLTGLSHGLGGYGDQYFTAIAHTASTITFRGTRQGITIDNRETLRRAVLTAGPGRNNRSSWAIAISKRLRAALDAPVTA